MEKRNLVLILAIVLFLVGCTQISNNTGEAFKSPMKKILEEEIRCFDSDKSSKQSMEYNVKGNITHSCQGISSKILLKLGEKQKEGLMIIQKGKKSYQCKFKEDRCEGEQLVEETCLGKGSSGLEVSYDCREEGKVCEEGVCVSASCLNQECQDRNLNFLIITRPLFLDSLQEFIQWKYEEFNFKVGILTLEYISENYEGEDLGIKIRKAIHSIKEDNGAEYVLLIGDTFIPFQDWGYNEEDILSSYSLEEPWNLPTMYYDRKGTEKTDLLPSDLPYTTPYSWLDPPIVNPSSHELNFVAEVQVGRWPIRTTDELDRVIEKTINIKPIEKVLLMGDTSVVGDPNIPVHEGCRSWPPHEFYEFFCYLDIFWAVRTRLLEGRIDYNLVLANVSDKEEATNAQNIIFSTAPNTALSEQFHGNAWGLYFGPHINRLTAENIDMFQHAFPLMEAFSCMIGAFYYSEQDSYAEVLVKNNKGPAVFVQAPNPYYFYENLLEGKTVGESFYSGTDVYVFGENPYFLFGDPSLTLMQR